MVITAKGDKPEGEGSQKESETKVETKEEKPVEVDGTHPEVIAIVEAAVKDAEKNPVQMPPEAYIEVMEAAIKDCERELRKNNPEGPM